MKNFILNTKRYEEFVIFTPFNQEPFSYNSILCLCETLWDSMRLFTDSKCYYYLKFWKRKQWRFLFESTVSALVSLYFHRIDSTQLNNINENKLLRLDNDQNVLSNIWLAVHESHCFYLLERTLKTCVESWIFLFWWIYHFYNIKFTHCSLVSVGGNSVSAENDDGSTVGHETWVY